MNRPRVSVVVLSHRAEFLPGAIASVLMQSAPKDAVQLLVNYAHEAYLGKFNSIADAVRGDFLIPLCDDDRLGADYIGNCLAVADLADGADIVVTDRVVEVDIPEGDAWKESNGIGPSNVWREFDGERYPLLPALRDDIPGYYRFKLNPDAFEFGQTLPWTCMIRKRFWDVMNGYDESVPHCDTEFWARAAQVGAKVHYIPLPLWQYRKHNHADVVPFLRAFHRKNFRRFGQAWEHAVEVRPGLWRPLCVHPDKREEYIEKFYPELRRTPELAGSNR